jgi:hypothetical protein
LVWGDRPGCSWRPHRPHRLPLASFRDRPLAPGLLRETLHAAQIANGFVSREASGFDWEIDEGCFERPPRPHRLPLAAFRERRLGWIGLRKSFVGSAVRTKPGRPRPSGSVRTADPTIVTIDIFYPDYQWLRFAQTWVRSGIQTESQKANAGRTDPLRWAGSSGPSMKFQAIRVAKERNASRSLSLRRQSGVRRLREIATGRLRIASSAASRGPHGACRPPR